MPHVLGEVGRQGAPDHQPNEGVFVGLRERQGRHVPAVTQDRGRITEPEDLLHPMGNVENGGALSLELPNEILQLAGCRQR